MRKIKLNVNDIRLKKVKEVKEMSENNAPVSEGDELDVEIISEGEKKDGMAKVEGFVIFVPGTKKGDKVKIKVTKVLRNVGFAEVIQS